MTKYGYNGNPFKNGAVSGTIILNEFITHNIEHGIQEGWYAENELGNRNITVRSIKLAGKIQLNSLPIVLDETKQTYQDFWINGVHCSFSIYNYLDEKNTFKPTRIHYPSIGICGRYGEKTEILKMDIENGFWGSILLNNFTFNSFQNYIQNKWTKTDEGKLISRYYTTNIALEFKGYACYGARIFDAPSSDYKKNVIIIKSFNEYNKITTI
jgi:hypothetical protein